LWPPTLMTLASGRICTVGCWSRVANRVVSVRLPSTRALPSSLNSACSMGSPRWESSRQSNAFQHVFFDELLRAGQVAELAHRPVGQRPHDGGPRFRGQIFPIGRAIELRLRVPDADYLARADGARPPGGRQWLQDGRAAGGTRLDHLANGLASG